MITRDLKLKLTKKQETTLNGWLWILTGVFNWASRKIEQDAQNKIFHSKLNFQNLLADHGKRIGIPSHTIQGTLLQAHNAWNRCFKKIAKKPRLKGFRNKLHSIPFPDQIPQSRIKEKSIRIPLLGDLRFYKQEIPDGKIKCSRIIKRASGWYLQITIDTIHTFQVKETEEKVGIDTGFKSLAALSNGKKYKNCKNFVKGQKRLAKAQRGNNKKLVARLHERIKNRRKDHNHKVSREIVQNNKEIYITNDNLRGQSRIFGKSVQDAGIAQLRNFIIYKSGNHGRFVKLVNSRNTTKTCGECGSLRGPTGLHMLHVRNWECSACGAHLDRDINSANVILKFGLGCSLVNLESSGGAR
jgi:putative transposase